MRILFVHPNYRSGGAEIAGTWPLPFTLTRPRTTGAQA